MSWSVRSSIDPDKFVSYSEETGWSADEVTALELERAGGPFADAFVTPVGPVHVSRGEGDEVALYLNARNALPGGVLVEEGSHLPTLPDVPKVPRGAVA